MMLKKRDRIHKVESPQEESERLVLSMEVGDMFMAVIKSTRNSISRKMLVNIEREEVYVPFGDHREDRHSGNNNDHLYEGN